MYSIQCIYTYMAVYIYIYIYIYILSSQVDVILLTSSKFFISTYWTLILLYKSTILATFTLWSLARCRPM